MECQQPATNTIPKTGQPTLVAEYEQFRNRWKLTEFLDSGPNRLVVLGRVLDGRYVHRDGARLFLLGSCSASLREHRVVLREFATVNRHTASGLPGVFVCPNQHLHVCRAKGERMSGDPYWNERMNWTYELIHFESNFWGTDGSEEVIWMLPMDSGWFYDNFRYTRRIEQYITKELTWKYPRL